MFTLLGVLIGCYAHAYDVDVHSHTHYVGHDHYVSYVTEQSRWIPGHYNRHGNWVTGYWTNRPIELGRRPVQPRRNCHQHADGRSHCGRH
jgi:hypothetical protein